MKYTQNNNGERYNPNYEGKLKRFLHLEIHLFSTDT